eukprot:gene4798-5865_t
MGLVDAPMIGAEAARRDLKAYKKKYGGLTMNHDVMIVMGAPLAGSTSMWSAQAATSQQVQSGDHSASLRGGEMKADPTMSPTKTDLDDLPSTLTSEEQQELDKCLEEHEDVVVDELPQTMDSLRNDEDSWTSRQIYR